MDKKDTELAVPALYFIDDIIKITQSGPPSAKEEAIRNFRRMYKGAVPAILVMKHSKNKTTLEEAWEEFVKCKPNEKLILEAICRLSLFNLAINIEIEVENELLDLLLETDFKIYTLIRAYKFLEEENKKKVFKIIKTASLDFNAEKILILKRTLREHQFCEKLILDIK